MTQVMFVMSSLVKLLSHFGGFCLGKRISQDSFPDLKSSDYRFGGGLIFFIIVESQIGGLNTEV